ncbi:hypothetical protein BD311DRAFT_744438 [Dichomitus squalens]|uniref:Uncharacterized protein n=1 Tax=Dichomitus squalens TaxID=114155 RepID=A0A4Q9N8S4_9APHY|nr:hypothetical protein BD311DRAFT_744438 [Dichomitus squalens]
MVQCPSQPSMSSASAVPTTLSDTFGTKGLWGVRHGLARCTQQIATAVSPENKLLPPLQRIHPFKLRPARPRLEQGPECGLLSGHLGLKKKCCVPPEVRATVQSSKRGCAVAADAREPSQAAYSRRPKELPFVRAGSCDIVTMAERVRLPFGQGFRQTFHPSDRPTSGRQETAMKSDWRATSQR